MQLDRPLATVTPTLDGDVLRVLAQSSAAFTAGQMRRTLDSYSEHGVRKVLVRLADQGVVHGEHIGNAVAYRLNRDHVAAPAIIELANARERLLDRMRRHFESWPTSLRYACVFGSAVSGIMRTDSDLDVLLVSRDARDGMDWDERFVDLSIQLFRWTGNRPSLIEMSEGELADRAAEPLVQQLRSSGVTVAGRRDWFDRRTRVGVANR